MKKRIGMTFTRDLDRGDPLKRIGVKVPVYLRLLELIAKSGFEAWILTPKTYQGNGTFEGGWFFDKDQLKLRKDLVKIDLVYDRTAGIKFPPKKDNLIVVNQREFKILAWDKWLAYQSIGEFMPKTFLLEDEKEISKVVSSINTDWVVLKPYNGLKGLGVFIGPKEKALNFKFHKKFKKYIAQEFVDTSGGIPGITGGLHDLRLAIVNSRVVWSHVRVPPKGSFKSNAAGGGVLKEIQIDLIPGRVTKIAKEISKIFSKKYDNPIYSLDFGISKEGRPYIFEINDQIGFPKWEMKNRDIFLDALVTNFRSKLG